MGATRAAIPAGIVTLTAAAAPLPLRVGYAEVVTDPDPSTPYDVPLTFPRLAPRFRRGAVGHARGRRAVLAGFDRARPRHTARAARGRDRHVPFLLAPVVDVLGQRQIAATVFTARDVWNARQADYGTGDVLGRRRRVHPPRYVGAGTPAATPRYRGRDRVSIDGARALLVDRLGTVPGRRVVGYGRSIDRPAASPWADLRHDHRGRPAAHDPLGPGRDVRRVRHAPAGRTPTSAEGRRSTRCSNGARRARGDRPDARVDRLDRAQLQTFADLGLAARVTVDAAI